MNWQSGRRSPRQCQNEAAHIQTKLSSWEANRMIDDEILRQELLDKLGTAWMNGNPAAMTEISEVENANLEELLTIAERFGL